MLNISRGIGANANLVFQDEQLFIYEYGGYNLNEPKFRNENCIYDGNITINKCCFDESDIDNMINEGLILIENCSNCWHMTEGKRAVDIMALHVIFCIFRQYKKEGNIPKHISFNL